MHTHKTVNQGMLSADADTGFEACAGTYVERIRAIDHSKALVNDEALLLSIYLRDEKRDWIPRIVPLS